MIIRREIKVLLTLLIPVLMSCNGSQDKNILVYTDTLLVEDPKQALSILDSLDNAGTLNEKKRMHLVWNRAMAHQALGMSLAEDDQLTEAIAYYRAQKEKLADSYLLEASYLSWMDKSEDAIRAIDKGMPVEQVQRLLGHARVEFEEHDVGVHIGADLQGPWRHLAQVRRVIVDV